VSELEPAEVAEALAALKTLDREEWGTAWRDLAPPMDARRQEGNIEPRASASEQ